MYFKAFWLKKCILGLVVFKLLLQRLRTDHSMWQNAYQVIIIHYYVLGGCDIPWIGKTFKISQVKCYQRVMKNKMSVVSIEVCNGSLWCWNLCQHASHFQLIFKNLAVQTMKYTIKLLKFCQSFRLTLFNITGKLVYDIYNVIYMSASVEGG